MLDNIGYTGLKKISIFAFCNVFSKKSKITFLAPIIFLLDSTALRIKCLALGH